MTKRTLILAATLAVAPTFAHAETGRPLVSGEAIMLGDGRADGPLAVGLSSQTIGTVTLAGDAGPSLLVSPYLHSAKPGLYLARFLRRDARGVPVFARPIEIDHPRGRGKLPGVVAVFTDAKGTTHGLFVAKSKLTRATFDPAKGFVANGNDLAIDGLPAAAGWIAARPRADGGVDLLFGVKDDVDNKPVDAGVKDWRDPLYRPFDGAGVYRGGWPYCTLYSARVASIDGSETIVAQQASTTKRESILSLGNLTPVRGGWVSGSWFGNLAFYADAADGKLAEKQLLADANALAIRHPTVRPEPIVYGNNDDLIVGGEGGLYLYRYVCPGTYADPTPALEADARLYTGSLPVVNAADWDGDGVTDLVVGNSEGKILFFRNAGTAVAPSFVAGVELHAEGKPIHVQPGYADVQGPQEARWGYVSPSVVDWNGDGLPDLVTSSATAKHELYGNVGTKQQPKLVGPLPLFSDGLDLHGTWRVRPAAATLGKSMAYVALDDQDQIHLWRRIDDQNLRDAGKLTFEDGSPIGANFLASGGTGRSKFTLVDFDRDGKVDLLVGTPRHGAVGGAIGDKSKGLPQSLGLKGAAIVFLRNVGTDDAPTYAQPTLLKFKGEPIYVGQHECSVAVWDASDPKGPGIVVGEQEGRVLYFAREDLSW